MATALGTGMALEMEMGWAMAHCMCKVSQQSNRTSMPSKSIALLHPSFVNSRKESLFHSNTSKRRVCNLEKEMDLAMEKETDLAIVMVRGMAHL